MNVNANDGATPFDWEQLRPKPSDWLETHFRYTGDGTAELTSPRGTIAGTFIAEFDEYGSSSIETVFPNISPCDADYENNPIAFLSGAKPQRSGKATTWGIGVDSDNPCESLSFVTAHGTFMSTGTVAQNAVGWGTGPTRIRFFVREGKFETSSARPAKYFAIPLFNCVAEPTNQLHGQHPLRIFPTPSIPDDVRSERKQIASMVANEMNAVLAFLIDGRLCFVERLPDYKARVAELKSGAAQRKITAVLVGDIGSNPVANLADFRAWFPSGIFSALSFASGVEVGWPWIEIRDEQGGLIRRLHGDARVPSFFEGDNVFGKFSRPGAGEFVASFATLPKEKRTYLQVVMNHARLGSLGPHLYLPDLLAHLVRALDCLCREHHVTSRVLTAGLSAEAKNKLNELTTEFTTKLKRLSDYSKQSGNLEDHSLLGTITRRAESIGQKANELGLAAVKLLKKLDFSDASVLDRFLTAKGRPDWATLISTYRNATIHEGYLDFSNKHDVNEVIQICAHLKDVLTRIILKECEYSGTYDSVLRHSYGPQAIDWVRPDTNASDLRFT